MAGLQSHTQFPPDYGFAMILNSVLAKDPTTEVVLVFNDENDERTDKEKSWFTVYAPDPREPKRETLLKVFSFHAQEENALEIANQRYPQRYQKFLQRYRPQTSAVSLSA